jgi:large subunit ribosomal protein L29
MKANDLRERSVEDLRELEKSLTRDAFTHRFKNFTNRLDDTSLIAKTRRDLARVKTLLQEHALMAKTKAASEGNAPKAAAAKTAKPKKSTRTKKSEAK